MDTDVPRGLITHDGHVRWYDTPTGVKFLVRPGAGRREYLVVFFYNGHRWHEGAGLYITNPLDRRFDIECLTLRDACKTHHEFDAQGRI